RIQLNARTARYVRKLQAIDGALVEILPAGNHDWRRIKHSGAADIPCHLHTVVAKEGDLRSRHTGAAVATAIRLHRARSHAAATAAAVEESGLLNTSSAHARTTWSTSTRAARAFARAVETCRHHIAMSRVSLEVFR